MRNNLFYLTLWLLLFSSCSNALNNQDVKTSASYFRSHQFSLYHTNDTKVVMEAIANVLKDQGFTIKTIHYELGFVSAIKDLDKNIAENLVSENYKGMLPSTLELTANLIHRKEDIAVKLHFISKAFNQAGVVQALEVISNQDIYQQFFEKISHYLQLSKITSVKS